MLKLPREANESRVVAFRLGMGLHTLRIVVSEEDR